MKVLVLPEVQEYLRELIQILYRKEYFGFEETAAKYVEDLFHDIKTTLPVRYKKNAPKYFNRYGKDMYYSIFRKSKYTQWYIFFTIYKDKKETIYLIRYISNNHVIAQYL
ncbi:MAG: hypothetical protein LBN74_08120 [Prevotella sp.]|jgi:hypothetical protein|nr:hypothetical protein [Prevotella sp.]